MRTGHLEKAIQTLGNNPTLSNFISHFVVFTESPGGVDKLRKLILSLAVSGALTHKESNSNVDEEIEQALEAKKTYEKELKLRKNSPLAQIAEEPYIIPSHWKWAKLEDIACYIQRGKGPKYDDENTSELVVSQKCIQWEGFSIDKARGVSATTLEKYGQERFLNQGDLLWNSTGTGTVGRVSVLDKSIECKLVADSHVTVIRLSNMVPRYIWCCIANPWVQDRIEPEHEDALVSGSTKQVELSTTAVRGLPIPVAPIEEQIRIVAKVDELMALCDQLEAKQHKQANTILKANTASIQALLSPSNSKDELLKHWQRIADNFHTLYGNTLPMPPGDGRQKKHLIGLENVKNLRNLISSLAVEGKLSIHSNKAIDITSIKNQCQNLKKEYISNKWLRKQKNIILENSQQSLSQYPKHWMVEPFDEIALVIGGVTKGRKLSNREVASYPYLRVANVQRGYFELDVMKDITIPVEEYGKYKLEDGDLLITEGGDWDKVGRTAIWHNQIPECLHQNHVFKAKIASKDIKNSWIELVFNSGVGRNYFAGCSKQTTNLASINMTQLRCFPLPIPPLDEQEDIIHKVKKLMTLCDKLEQQLTTAYNDAERLVTATTKALVA